VISEEAVEGALPAEGGKKRKRRRKKKKGAGDGAAVPEQAETTAAVVDQVVHDVESEPATDDGDTQLEGSDESATKPKKRKRRRGRKGPKLPGDVIPESEATSADFETAQAVVPKPEPAAAEVLETLLAAEKPKRPRPSRAKKTPVAETAAPANEKPVPEAVTATEISETPAPKARRRAAPKKAAIAVVVPVPEAVAEKPKAAPRARRKKAEPLPE
jgi:ribonuclease E